LDFVNNVVYNWGIKAGYNAQDSSDNPAGFTNHLNYVGNYLIAGTNTTSQLNTAFESGVASAAFEELYQTDNRIDSNRNGVLDGVDTGWGMFSSPYNPMAAPFALPGISLAGNTDAAPVAFERVLAFVGASQSRDAADVGVVNDVRNQTGHIINSQAEVGGWPALDSLPLPLGGDPDNDGLPDAWELTFGLNPADGADGNQTNALGYTRLEDYLNWLGDPHAIANTNTPVAVDLRSIAGKSGNLTFLVGNGTNGTVTLQPDGHTAVFTPANNFGGGTNYGLASFIFSVINNDTANSFGPVTVNLLVSKVPVAVANPFTVTITRATPSGVTLRWNGTAAQQFQVKWTTNVLTPLTSWGTITNPFIYSGGTWSFFDDGTQTVAPNRERFYRVQLLP
jgi:hypothetical protein